MRPEYGFLNAVRGKYHKAFHESSNVVILEPDVADRFRNSKAVNEALRAILRIAGQAKV